MLVEVAVLSVGLLPAGSEGLVDTAAQVDDVVALFPDMLTVSCFIFSGRLP